MVNVKLLILWFVAILVFVFLFHVALPDSLWQGYLVASGLNAVIA